MKKFRKIIESFKINRKFGSFGKLIENLKMKLGNSGINRKLT